MSVYLIWVRYDLGKPVKIALRVFKITKKYIFYGARDTFYKNIYAEKAVSCKWFAHFDQDFVKKNEWYDSTV